MFEEIHQPKRTVREVLEDKIIELKIADSEQKLILADYYMQLSQYYLSQSKDALILSEKYLRE